MGFCSYSLSNSGYGFLSESGKFAQSLLDAKVTWVGPPPEVLHLFGDKIEARRYAQKYNVPVVRGSGNLHSSEECMDVLHSGRVRLPAIMKVCANMYFSGRNSQKYSHSST